MPSGTLLLRRSLCLAPVGVHLLKGYMWWLQALAGGGGVAARGRGVCGICVSGQVTPQSFPGMQHKDSRMHRTLASFQVNFKGFFLYLGYPHLMNKGQCPSIKYRETFQAPSVPRLWQMMVKTDVVPGGPEGGVGLGWVVACPGGGFPRPVCPSLTSTTGSNPACLVSQPPRLLMPPTPHQGASAREMPPCLCVVRACRGGCGGRGVRGTGSGHSGAPLFFCCGLWSSCWRVWGVVCARCSGPQQRGMGARPQGC